MSFPRGRLKMCNVVVTVGLEFLEGGTVKDYFETCINVAGCPMNPSNVLLFLFNATIFSGVDANFFFSDLAHVLPHQQNCCQRDR